MRKAERLVNPGRQILGKNEIRKAKRVGEIYRKHQKIPSKSCFKHMRRRKLAGVCRYQ